MADIDVSDVLDDPDFNTTFQVTRTSTSAPVGLTQLVPSTPTPTIGVVQPAGGRDLERLPDLERASGAIVIWTRAQLISKSSGFTADLVAWNGANYTVVNVEPWAYGSGYFKALCQLEDLT